MKPIRIYPSRVLAENRGGRVGINVNFLTDGAYLQKSPKSLKNALKEMGVRYLRYPGGEKSDSYLWSVPPFDKPRPTFARKGKSEMRFPMWAEDDYATIKPGVMDFDRFMELCHEVECEPHIVVCFDSMYIPPFPGGTAPSRQELCDTACAWVRYANVVKGYDVKRWEIGNESYVHAHHNAAKIDDYTRDLITFAKGMKAVDPSILIYANGPTGLDANETTWGRMDADTKKPWWETLLPQAANVIDGLAFHDYPCFAWGSYDYYCMHDVRFADAEIKRLKALIEQFCPSEAGRLRLALTETNSADWSTGKPGIEKPGWSRKCTWGHALVLFDMLASYARQPEVESALVWNTRWYGSMSSGNPLDYEFWDVLDTENNLLPAGQVIRFLNRYMLDTIVDVSSEPGLPVFASVSDDKVCVFIINKQLTDRRAVIDLSPFAGRRFERATLYGESELAGSVMLDDGLGFTPGDEPVELTLRPVSVTALRTDYQLQKGRRL